MIRLLTIFLLFILTDSPVSAHEKSEGKKVSVRKQNKILMRKQIEQLKKGALLVRLHTRENSIKALNEIKKFELANKIKVKQEIYNKKIISAFRNYFDFCPVYFFFSDYSEGILSNNFNGIVFLNDSLLPDTSINFTHANFLIAEFGMISQDTAKYFSNDHFAHKIANEKRSAYYGGPNMRFDALKIMSDQFVQLRRPFPYYVRTFNTLPIIRRDPFNAVMRMNKKLMDYYQNYNGR